MAMRAVALLSLISGVSGQAVELTEKNFDNLVFKSGKAGFVKFFAPWCGHCKKMKPDWDQLGEEFEDSKKVIIGDVDCTSPGGKPLCERFGTQGFPTIMYFNPPDQEGESYDGERSFDALNKFATTKLGPMCSVDNLAKCSKQQKEELQPYLDTPVEELEEQLAQMKTKLATAQKEHDDLLAALQQQYKESDEKTKALKAELTPKIKLTKAAIPAKKDASNKDEV